MEIREHAFSGAPRGRRARRARHRRRAPSRAAPTWRRFAIGARSRGTPAPAARSSAARSASIPSSVSDETASAPGRRARPTPAARSLLLATTTRGLRAVVVEQRAIVVGQQRRSDRARRSADPAAPRRLPRARDAFFLDRVAGARAQPAVSTIVSGTPPTSTRSVKQIARRARHVRHDRARRAGEPVEEARLCPRSAARRSRR